MAVPEDADTQGDLFFLEKQKNHPRAEEAFRIAQALKVSVEYLLTGADQPKGPSNPAVHEIAETVPFFDDNDLQTLLATVRAMAARYRGK
jgi:transcriptional regulator with XRE-family HTH domain